MSSIFYLTYNLFIYCKLVTTLNRALDKISKFSLSNRFVELKKEIHLSLTIFLQISSWQLQHIVSLKSNQLSMSNLSIMDNEHALNFISNAC